MFLIMSAAYISQELQSEFGRIPPSFLPLGNRRLFQHQVKLAPDNCDVFLSLPESFQIAEKDRQWLEANHVSIIHTPDSLSLGASLIASINMTGVPLVNPLHLLYGDTLFGSLPEGNDLVSISQIRDSYDWAVVTQDHSKWLQTADTSTTNEYANIIDGYFKFSNPRTLLKCITQSQWNFIEGLNRYHSEVGLTTVVSDGWLDFGHVNTYYRSKAEFTTQRAFNTMTITTSYIEKSSSHNKKIEAEAFWFEHLPASLRIFTPQFLGSIIDEDKTKYQLEYLHQTALNELFVFAELPTHAWKPILENCIEFLKTCISYTPQEKTIANHFESLFGEKTVSRLEEFCSQRGININSEWVFNRTHHASITQLLADSQHHLPAASTSLSVLHGDFCFSNILYDSRSHRIKTIDPRGLTPEGEFSIYGDIYYDVAKLSHSVLGLYDFIIAGYYSVKVQDNAISFDIHANSQQHDIQTIFLNLINKNFNLTASHLYAMQIQLFLSMLPLHADDPVRQDALFANAFRLHTLLQEGNQ